MKLYIPSATLSVLLLSPSFANAEDIPDSHELRNFSIRSQSSGIAPPQEELGVYVVNSGPGLIPVVPMLLADLYLSLYLFLWS